MTRKNYEWKIGKALPELGAHSLAKHRILEAYITRYLEIVTATAVQEQLNITFVDGYAGGGRYRCGQLDMPGSPLILLETVAKVEAKLNAERAKGFRINAEFIFIDDKAQHTEFLRAQIETSAFKSELDGSIHIWTADFNERVGDLVARVRARSPRAGRSIFLLDQFGWSQVAFRSIRTIINSLSKAEVFLTFSVDSLIDYLSGSSHDLKAFGEIDADPAFVRELARIKESEQVGYRAVIQNGLYGHVQKATEAKFYSPFFIKSAEAHRSYWFIHLSPHREARNAIGTIHWQENNTTVHHGGAGLYALGFASGRNPDQYTLEYLFDAPARERSRATLKEQLPGLIFQAAEADQPPTMEELFGLRCNDTPVIREIIEEVLVDLRDQREIRLFDEDGKEKPRANSVAWTDRIILPAQKTLFSSIAKAKVSD
jgi:three-Cys-motif partner protein